MTRFPVIRPALALLAVLLCVVIDRQRRREQRLRRQIIRLTRLLEAR